MNTHRTGKHWTHCTWCEQPNPNWEWTNYCPACRERFYRENNIEGYWVPEDPVEKAWREGSDLPGPDDFGDKRGVRWIRGYGPCVVSDVNSVDDNGEIR